MDECLKRVVVSVAVVPDPGARCFVRTEANRAQVHCQTVESQQGTVVIDGGTIGRATKAFVIHGTHQMRHGQNVDNLIVCERFSELFQIWN